MLINFNDLLFLSNKVNGIIHIGAHKLEELPDYLKGNVRRVIWVEAPSGFSHVIPISLTNLS